MPLPPEPPQTAMRIAGDVAFRVRPDFDDLRSQLATDLRASDHWHPLMEAERLARQAIEPLWTEIQPSCERALDEVHEQYRVAASNIREARDDLLVRGAESWIAGAVLHQLASRIAWDALGDCGLLLEFDEEGEEVGETQLSE